jgi:hypothetical protein
MSFHLIVFDVQASPRDRLGFLNWYKEQVRWFEDHSYDDDALATPQLRVWFSEMRQGFPALNGSYSTDDLDNPRLTEYKIGQHIICASFGWAEAPNGLKEMFRLATKHKVGFFDVSAIEGGVWMPNSSGRYLRVHGSPQRKSKSWELLRAKKVAKKTVLRSNRRLEEGSHRRSA